MLQSVSSGQPTSEAAAVCMIYIERAPRALLHCATSTKELQQLQQLWIHSLLVLGRGVGFSSTKIFQNSSPTRGLGKCR